MMCPRCNRNELVSPPIQNALSRKDDKTYVCSPCGVDEAVWDFTGSAHPEWPLPPHYEMMSFSSLMKDDHNE